MTVHTELERELSEFLGTEETILFASGYHANTGLFESLYTNRDYVFCDDLIQSEELGRPVSESLERLAERVRTQRVQEATETAGRAKVLVLIPITLVFVAVLLLLFAPFIVRYFYGGYVAL